jgi:hypothetical protein
MLVTKSNFEMFKRFHKSAKKMDKISVEKLLQRYLTIVILKWHPCQIMKDYNKKVTQVSYKKHFAARTGLGHDEFAGVP